MIPEPVRGTVAVILALGLAVLAVFVGIAILTANGQAQTCARAGGHWVERFDSTSPVADGWIDNKDCVR